MEKHEKTHEHVAPKIRRKSNEMEPKRRKTLELSTRRKKTSESNAKNNEWQVGDETLESI